MSEPFECRLTRCPHCGGDLRRCPECGGPVDEDGYCDPCAEKAVAESRCKHPEMYAHLERPLKGSIAG